MIPLEVARTRVLAGCTPLAPRPVAVAEVAGLVLAADVVAGELIPPFDNTAVDGFAVRSVDVTGAGPSTPVVLDVVGTVAAGAVADRAVGAGQAILIMTGAPIPPGADAVVMVEDTTALDGGDRVAVGAAVGAGSAIRPAGDDVRPGTVVFRAGEELSAAHLGVLRSLGLVEVVVHPRPRVGVLSTGDELVEGPVALRPGQIRDSNRATLLALVAAAGCVPVDLGLQPDVEATIAAAFEDGARHCDALLSSGGVSMGDFDYVKRVLDRVGEMNWMQIAIKPAKPLAFGHVHGVPCFGLPGNPVSSMVSFELFARPGLRRLGGHPDDRLARPPVRAVAPEGLRRTPDGKTHFQRVVADYDHARATYVVRTAGGQGSHHLAAMAAANALAVVPDGDGVAAGGSVDVLLLR